MEYSTVSNINNNEYNNNNNIKKKEKDQIEYI